jgi:TorA maturation chaperone TorD
MMRAEARSREGAAAEPDAFPASQLLAQADMLLLAADLLRPGPPRGHVIVPTAADAAELAAAAFPGRADVREALEALLAGASETDERRWSDEYHRLFEGPLACPVNETAYIRRDKGAILADLCGFYRAFGFAPASDAGEKPDHMRCELEFAAMLLVKMAGADAAGRVEDAEVTRHAIAAFAEDHLTPWLATFCTHLKDATSLSFYRSAAAMLDAVWQAMVEWHRWPHAVPSNAPAADDASPYECGMAETESAVQLRVDGRPVVRANAPQR